MNEASSDQSPVRSSAWIPYVALLVSLGMTAIGTAYVSRTTEARNQSRFENTVDELRGDIIARMETYIGYLRGAAGLFAADKDVTREQWGAYVGRLELPRYSPGIQGIGYTRRLQRDEYEAVLTEMRTNATADARLWPEHDGSQRYAIVYLEPMDRRNIAALGYDMHHDPKRREAMAKARDEAMPVASAKVRLVQELDEKSPQAGFLIYVPVYRGGVPPPSVEERERQLMGFVYSPYRVGDLIRGMFRAQLSSTVRFDLYDGAPRLENLMHQGPTDSGYRPRYTTQRPVTIGGRTWTLQFASLPRFEVEVGRDLTPFVAIGGILMSLVLFALTRSQTAARGAAERIAMDLRASENRLRASESRFRRLADANLIGVVFCDLSGRINNGNDEFFRQIGHEREPVLHKPIRMEMLTPPQHRAADAVAIAELRAQGVVEPYEKEFIRPDGSRIPVLVGMAMLEGSDSECVAFSIDLTEAKQSAREVERAKELAESANRAKDQFLAVLSHELRTPLTPVLAIATSAQLDPNLPATIREDFAMIRRNVELEAKLIDDLLDLTRIGRGKIQLHLEVVDVHQAIRNAIKVCSSDEVELKRLTILEDLKAQKHHVRGDAARIQQVFWNLLKNAVKFTPPGGTITVATLNESQGKIVVNVTDSGVGIEPHLLPKIFDAFEQGDMAAARNFGGLGLGLAISKGLVVAHGATISAHSEGANRGATFRVVLSTTPVKAPTTAPAPHEPSEAGSGLSILLVEDHVDTARALKRLLDDCGYHVRAADSVQSALQVAAQTDFDVVVSDLGLPDGSGLDIMRQLRARHNGRLVKGIALTGFGMEEDIARSRDAGFTEHITKPVNFHNLQQAIERVRAST